VLIASVITDPDSGEQRWTFVQLPRVEAASAIGAVSTAQPASRPAATAVTHSSLPLLSHQPTDPVPANREHERDDRYGKEDAGAF
jgi:hypothetical protein